MQPTTAPAPWCQFGRFPTVFDVGDAADKAKLGTVVTLDFANHARGYRRDLPLGVLWDGSGGAAFVIRVGSQ